MYKLILLTIVIFLVPKLNQQHLSLLDKRLNMTVYAAEILESVINRVDADSSTEISFCVKDLLSFWAKARVYQNVTIREILDDQVTGTPFRYRFNRNRHWEIYRVLNNTTDQ